MPVLKRPHLLILCFAAAIILAASCSTDSPTDDDGDGEAMIMLPLEGGMQNIQLPANQAINFNLTVQVPPEIKQVESASINVAGTLNNASVTYQGNVLKAAFLAAFYQTTVTGRLLVRVGETEAAACASEIVYGPYDLTPGFFGAPEPSEIPLDQASIQVVNRGTVVLCLEMLSSVDANININEIAFDVTQRDCQDTGNFAGVWEGSYQCGNSCGGEFGGNVRLTVTQNGNSATYVDDGGDTYTGSVCGDVFRFARTGDNEESERGTLTLLGPNQAVKRSTWRSLGQSYCFGNCVDNLTRVAGG